MVVVCRQCNLVNNCITEFRNILDERTCLVRVRPLVRIGQYKISTRPVQSAVQCLCGPGSTVDCAYNSQLSIMQ